MERRRTFGDAAMAGPTALEADARREAAKSARERLFSPSNLMLLSAIVGVFLGVVVNLFTTHSQRTHRAFTDIHQLIKLPGQVWLRGLSLAVLPFIASNMTMSLADLKRVEGAGPTLIKRTVGYYLLTTLLACFLGLLLSVLMLVPNVKTLSAGVPTGAAGEHKTVVDQVYSIFYGIVPSNIVQACATNNLLGVITFFAILGFLIDNSDDAAPSPIYAIMKEVNTCMNAIILSLVSFAPVGVFCLLYATLASVEDMGSLWKSAGILIGTCYVGVGCMTLGVYPLLYAVFHGGGSVFPYYGEIKEAVLTALGTSSSAATLPVTTRCVIRSGVSADLAKFVCSLGATVNMDGSAVTYPSFVLFMAAAQGVDITIAKAITIAFVSTLASVGAAPIPNAGSVLLIMICESVNVPVNGLLSICILVDAIFVDRFQTMNNIVGDSVAAKCLDVWNTTGFPKAAAALNPMAIMARPGHEAAGGGHGGAGGTAHGNGTGGGVGMGPLPPLQSDGHVTSNPLADDPEGGAPQARDEEGGVGEPAAAAGSVGMEVAASPSGAGADGDAY